MNVIFDPTLEAAEIYPERSWHTIDETMFMIKTSHYYIMSPKMGHKIYHIRKSGYFNIY